MKTKINKHFIYIFLAAVLWGMAGIFVRTCEQDGFEKMQMVFGRTLGTACIIGLIILFRDRRLFRIRPKDWWLFAGGGVFSILMFSFCYYKTMEYTTLSVAAVLLYTAPFFVIFLSLILFRQKLTVIKCVACLVAFVGCCLTTGAFRSGISIGTTALAFGLLTGLGYALYTIFSRLLFDRGYPALTIIFYVFLFASFASLFFSDPPELFRTITASPKSGLHLLMLAFFNSVLPYILYTKGLEGVDPTVAPIIATAEPVVATIVGAIAYHEKLTVTGGVGIVLILSAVLILNFKKGESDGAH